MNSVKTQHRLTFGSADFVSAIGICRSAAYARYAKFWQNRVGLHRGQASLLQRRAKKGHPLRVAKREDR
ncbi:hypothetical protein DMW99_02270 [Pseudomonas chlororaphis]|nr:hypothetical protein C1Y36_13685 [Pseudomonas sp. FW306-2-2C-D06C]PYC42202.1 hypothetical protein DMW99_02270 [Pseudomonas chlororaphis]